MKTTVDPMPVLMGLLFDKDEIIISDEILGAIKKMHSYTKKTCGKKEFYEFYKRGRGTHMFFTFSIINDGKRNKVSRLEYYTELGVSERYEYSQDAEYVKMVYMAFKGERRRKIKRFFKSLWWGKK